MANICDTELSIQKTENTKNFEDNNEAMIKWLNENYCYDDIENVNDDEDFMEVYCGTKWNLCTDVLQEFCKLFKVQVRAVGKESGVGFVQVAHINDKGEIISDEEIGFQF